jgi:hypothetical protein
MKIIRYESQGYKIVGRLPSDGEVAMVSLPGMDVHCILMRKCLAVFPLHQEFNDETSKCFGIFELCFP